MTLDLIENMEREELLQYVQSLLWQFRLCDAFWFLKTEEAFGQKAAETLNELVWAKVGELAGRDLAKRFGPFEQDLGGFWKAYRLFPWSLMVDYEIVSSEPEEMVVAVPCCPAQEGRARHGLGEYVCKHMHLAEFEGFARAVAPNVRVECLFAPPDEHPKNCHCKWRFTME